VVRGITEWSRNNIQALAAVSSKFRMSTKILQRSKSLHMNRSFPQKLHIINQKFDLFIGLNSLDAPPSPQAVNHPLYKL
jgi:hypothetical protein